MTERDAVETRVLAALTERGIEHERIPIDPALADTAAFCQQYGYPLEQAANTIVVATKKEPRRFAACVVLATTRLDVNRSVKALVGGGRLSFASAEQLAALTGMLVGGVTPFALPDDLRIYVDSAVMEPEWIIIGTGGRDSKLRIAPDAFRSLPSVRVETIAHPRA